MVERNLLGPDSHTEYLEAELHFLRGVLQGYLAWLKEEQQDFMAGGGYTKMAASAERQLRASIPTRFLGKTEVRS